MHAYSSLLFSNNVNFQSLKDVIEAAQLAAQLETNAPEGRYDEKS